ncbi:MAG: hypothetical protein NC342_09175 [Pseudoflavonifractor sp.]|nr:hypothetical protein [Alloprevotella sp.]MCM1117691.1 hypothetical protein [Pseudoflavonifractor sp.]
MNVAYQGRFEGRDPFRETGEKHPDGTPVTFTNSRTWTVRILTSSNINEAKELAFPAESPLVIEWDETKPEDVVEGSTATLRVFSPTFDQFTDLYTVNPRDVVLEVESLGDIVWRGTIEPELYSQPYALIDGVALAGDEPSGPGFILELTFTDFSPMESIDFEGEGRVAFSSIVYQALDATALQYDHSNLYASTTVNGRGRLELGDLYISADNFFDEDGKAMTCKEAVETVLAPLGLHLRQYGGEAYVYDWNELTREGGIDVAESPIEWTSIDATMTVGEVAHAVTINYSAYADADLADSTPDIDELGKVNADSSLIVNIDNNPEENVHGFTLYRYGSWPEGTLPPGMKVEGGRELFRIAAGYSGSNATGVYAYAKPAGEAGGVAFGSEGGSPVFTLTGPWLALKNTLWSSHCIKITLDLLLDVRYNPYEGAAKYNEEGNWSRLQNWANFGYIPVALELIGDDGRAVAHYENRKVKDSNSGSMMGEWHSGEAHPGDMWLAYYDPGNRKSASGWGGWKKNRQCIGYYRDDLPTLSEKRGEGEYVPVPQLTDTYAGGRLRLTVCSGADWMDYRRKGEMHVEGAAGGIFDHSLSSRVRWLLYGTAEMEIVKADGTGIPTDDRVFTATATPGAASEVGITLKAGSEVEAPTARATIYTYGGVRGDALMPASAYTFCRERTAGIEELLLDTLCSQYDTPRRILTGEASLRSVLLPSPQCITDTLSPGKLFIPTEASVDVISGTAAASFREISPDTYHPAE